MCVEIVSLGKVALSTSSTLNPPRARSIAAGDPAQRAPMMIASYMSASTQRQTIQAAGGFGHRALYPNWAPPQIG
jgi:hypothetical protein